MSAEALSRPPGGACAETLFFVLGLYHFLQVGYCALSAWAAWWQISVCRASPQPTEYPEYELVCVEPCTVLRVGWCMLDHQPAEAAQVCGESRPGSFCPPP